MSNKMSEHDIFRYLDGHNFNRFSPGRSLKLIDKDRVTDILGNRVGNIDWMIGKDKPEDVYATEIKSILNEIPKDVLSKIKEILNDNYHSFPFTKEEMRFICSRNKEIKERLRGSIEWVNEYVKCYLFFETDPRTSGSSIFKD